MSRELRRPEAEVPLQRPSNIPGGWPGGTTDDGTGKRRGQLDLLGIDGNGSAVIAHDARSMREIVTNQGVFSARFLDQPVGGA